MQTTEHILDMNGKWYRETRNRVELEVGDALARAVATNISVDFRRLVDVPGYGPINVRFESAGDSWWTLPIRSINFNTGFKVVDGIFIPTFAISERMEVLWEQPETDHTLAIVCVFHVSNSSDGPYVVHMYLYAMDVDGRAYRMPLANLYEHCEFCLGPYNQNSESAVSVILETLNQFSKSPWNSADLYDRNDQIKTAQFFRFSPSENGFTTLPVATVDWRVLCDKVSTPQLKNILL